MAPKQKEREFIVECIQLYRNLPILWNLKSKEYHDREKKNKAYEKLLNKYRKMYPEATKDDVKKKFNSLRTNYRKELKKHEQSIQSGGDEYVPSLWYYDEMKFLQELSSVDTQSEDILVEEEIFIDDIADERDEKYILGDSTSRNTLQPSPYSVPKPITEAKPINEELQELAAKRLADKLDPEYVNWALSCAADLSKMETMQQIYAKKAIAEIMMEGQLGLLDRNSVKINDHL